MSEKQTNGKNWNSNNTVAIINSVLSVKYVCKYVHVRLCFCECERKEWSVKVQIACQVHRMAGVLVIL